MSVALQAQRDSKVTTDLESLAERISLCAEMQKEASSDDEVSRQGTELVEKAIGEGFAASTLPSFSLFPHNSISQALLAVIGFLEACAPRVHALIQVGAEGVLSEDTFMKCLEVNDKLLAILSDSDDEPPAPSPAPTTTDDLLLSVEDTKAPPSNSMMSMQEDLAKVSLQHDSAPP